jgi:hypothetical protein
MHDSWESRGLDSLTRGLGTSRGLGSALTCFSSCATRGRAEVKVA